MPDSPTVVDPSTCRESAVHPAQVAAARDQLLAPEEASHLAELFRLLGDPTRTQILYALLEAGELCVCDLAAAIGVPETSVSHALRLLRTARIVRNRRAGRMVYYAIADRHVRLLLDVSREHLQERA